MSEEIPNVFKELVVRFTQVETKKMYHLNEEVFLRAELVEIHKRDAESVAAHHLFEAGLTLIKKQWLPSIEYGGQDLHVTYGKMCHG